MLRKSVVLVAALVACVLVGVGLYHNAVPMIKDSAREAAFRQLGKALSMYSDKSRGMAFPPKCREKNVFLPDMDELARGLASKWPNFREDPQIKALLETKDERPLCYLGHLVTHEEMMDVLLKRYEEDTSDSVRDRDIPTNIDAQYKTVYRLKQGIERFLICDIGNPAGSAQAQSRIPVLWEIPKNGKDQFLVCFMDGHVERLTYPLTFTEYRLSPMWVLSTHSLNAVRQALSLPLDPEPPAQPAEGPAAEAVRAALHVSEYWGDYCSGYFTFLSCDATPSVQVRGQAGYRADLGHSAELLLFPDSGEVSAISLMDLYFKPHSGFPLLHRLYLGSGMGFHWYGAVPYGLVKPMRRELRLTGGDDIYSSFAATVSPYRIEDPLPVGKREAPTPAQRISNLKEVMDRPSSVKRYADAYFILRDAEGQPVSQTVLDALGILYDCPLNWCIRNPYELRNEAQMKLAAAEDIQASVVAAVLLAIFWHGHESLPYDESTKLLSRLPKEPVVALLNHLAANLGDAKERAFAATLLESMEESGADSHGSQQ